MVSLISRIRAAPGLAGVVRVGSLMRGISCAGRGAARCWTGAARGGRGVAERDDGRDADAVVGRARHLEAGQACDVGADARRPGRRGRRRTAAARRPSAARGRRRRAAAGAQRLADLGDRDGHEVGVVALELGLLAGPAERGAQVHELVGELAGPGPLAEAEGARLDGAALDRRHEEPRPGQVARGPARSTARVTTASTPSRRSPSSRGRRRCVRRPAGARPGPRGRQTMTASASTACGRGGRADDQPPAAGRCARARARRPRCAASRRGSAARRRRASGSRPTPPRKPGERRSRAAVRRGRMPVPHRPAATRLSPRVARCPEHRHRRLQRQPARRARRTPRRAAARRAGRRPRRRAGLPT